MEQVNTMKIFDMYGVASLADLDNPNDMGTTVKRLVKKISNKSPTNRFWPKAKATADDGGSRIGQGQQKDTRNYRDNIAINQEDSTKAFAVKCLAAGLSVIPIEPNSKKAAIKWEQYQAQPMTKADAARLFVSGRGIAIVCGAISGNLECLDFDRPELFEPFLKTLKAVNPTLRDKLTVWQDTPSGGCHIVYRCTRSVAGNQKLAASADGKTAIETRGEGGYFLIAPSKGYTLHDDIENLPVLTPEELDMLHAIARSFDEQKPEPTPEEKKYTSANAAGGNRPGDIFEREADWRTLLEEAGWTYLHTTGNRHHWQRPGKEDNSTSATLNEMGLFVFSTNAGLPINKPLRKFAFLTFTKFNGDFKAAAKSLAESNGMDDTAEIVVPDWPIMPPAAYHGLAGDFVRLACRNSEADPAAVLATFLVRFGVECWSAPTLYVGDTTHKTRLAVVIVGASSKARKGTSGKPVEKLFNGIKEHARSSPGPFSSGEGIISEVRDEVTKWNPKKSTMEITDPGVNDKRLFILDEEFAGVMANTKREGNTLSMIIRNAWDSGNLDPLTKTNKIKATGAHIGWVSHVTLEELQRKLDDTEAFNGFANRILWVCARRQKEVPFPEPMPEEELKDIRKRLVDIISKVRGLDSVPIRWSEDAKTAWIEKHYSILTRDNPGLVGCVINRAEAQVVRLAMIYCLLDGGREISLEHLNAALAFWSYCEQSARFIFHGRQADTMAENILDALKEKGELSGTDLHGLFKNHMSSRKLKAALSSLIASGQVLQEQQSGNGRPATIYRLRKEETPCEKSEQSEESSSSSKLISLNSQGVKKNQGLTSRAVRWKSWRRLNN